MLALVERPEPVPRAGQVLVEVAVAGVNFMDLGARRGQFWTEMPLPRALGVEGAGLVLEVGDGVQGFLPGQRVAWAYAPGSYAERIAISADALVHVPDAIDDQTACAVMMQGLTASHFGTRFYCVQPGDVALVHAAAGGVGLLLTQIIKFKRGKVIGRVSHEDKVPIAKDAGADHVIVDSGGNFAQETIRLSGGEGVHVVYDGSGPATFSGSIESLRRCGTLCWYGPVLGGPGALDIISLPRSIKIGYANYADSVYSPNLLRTQCAQLFDWLAQGVLKVKVGGTYALRDAARAHTAMESRTTTGKLLLIP